MRPLTHAILPVGRVPERRFQVSRQCAQFCRRTATLGVRKKDEFRVRPNADIDDLELPIANVRSCDEERKECNTETGDRRISQHVAVVHSESNACTNDFNASRRKETPTACNNRPDASRFAPSRTG